VVALQVKVGRGLAAAEVVHHMRPKYGVPLN
jgi:hypothetical protein